MKNRYSYLEFFWVNKINSPFAELIMYFGDYKWNQLWLAPLAFLFAIFEVVIVYPVIKAEKYIRRIKRE